MLIDYVAGEDVVNRSEHRDNLELKNCLIGYPVELPETDNRIDIIHHNWTIYKGYYGMIELGMSFDLHVEKCDIPLLLVIENLKFTEVMSEIWGEGLVLCWKTNLVWLECLSTNY